MNCVIGLYPARYGTRGSLKKVLIVFRIVGPTTFTGRSTETLTSGWRYTHVVAILSS